MSSDLSNGQKAKTVQDKDIKVKIDNSGVMINDANVVVADVVVSNGVVHVVIDAIIPPPVM